MKEHFDVIIYNNCSLTHRLNVKHIFHLLFIIITLKLREYMNNLLHRVFQKNI